MSVGPIVTFDAQSPEARVIESLFVQTLVVCSVIGLLVAALVIYCIVRFRARKGDAEPKQVHGHTRLELAWTLIPCAIIAGLLVLTIRAVGASDPPPMGEPDLVIVGHQWWWEVKYSGGAITANEIHIPAGKKLLVRIEGADVIHSFWVPQLARKMDAVPGHPMSIWMQADQPGTYLGACTEYCGAQHAWMRIVVVAHPQAEFDAWLRHALEPASPPVAGEAADAEVRGARLFADKTCVKCHAIGGFGDQPRIGPDLTHFAERKTIGAGVLNNTPADLARWLAKPQEVKPLCHMPDLKLTPAEVTDLVAYFETLR